MLLIIAIDVITAGLLIAIAVLKGFERSLPLATFLLMLFPVESQIELPGLFDITTQRVLVLTLLGLYLTLGRMDRATAPARRLPLIFLFVLQLVWLCIATANSVVFTISLKTVLSQILDYFVVFYVFAKSIRNTETIRKILLGFAYAMILLSFLGAIEAYRGWSVISIFPETSHRFSVMADTTGDRTGRIQATFGHPILFGGTLALAIPVLLHLIDVSQNLRLRVLLWVGVMLMFLTIYKTGSRGPWIALMMSLALLSILGTRKVRKYLLVIALLVVTVLIARPGVWMTLRDIYASTRDPDSPMGESYQWRYALYDLAHKELARNTGRALWGYGPESFYYLGLTTEFMVDGDMHTVKVESCDSSVAALMMETGYAGLLITSLLLLTPLLISVRCYLTLSANEKSLPLLFTCNLGAFFFLMTNVAIYGWGQQSYLLWIILATASIYPQLVTTQTVPAAQSAGSSPELLGAACGRLAPASSLIPQNGGFFRGQQCIPWRRHD